MMQEYTSKRLHVWFNNVYCTIYNGSVDTSTENCLKYS